MATEISVPSVGESISEAVVSAWLVDEGEFVEQDAPVVVLETDKANVEVGAPASGVLDRIFKRAGDTVGVGEVIGSVRDGGAASAKSRDGGAGSPKSRDGGAGTAKPQDAHAAPAAASKPPADDAERPPAPGAAPSDRSAATNAAPGSSQSSAGSSQTSSGSSQSSSGSSQSSSGSSQSSSGSSQSSARSDATPSASARAPQEKRATPSARRLMMEAQVDPASVTPSGPAGRVTRDDVEAAMARPAGAAGQARTSSGAASLQGEAGSPRDEALEQVIPMSPLRRRVAQRLVEAQQTAALLTTFNEVDMSAILAVRKQHGESFHGKHGVKLGFMSFFVKAAVEALKTWPALNAEVRGTDIVYRNYYHIGVAVGSERGLVVPVVRSADRLSFAEIEKGIGDLAARARSGKLKLEELQGGTFTITNGGIYGSLLSTPIVNPPQSGILGMHKIEERPVAREGAVVIRPMMYLALTYDHRIIDGREAVSFLVGMRALLEDPTRILLEL